VPKHPETRAHLNQIEDSESRLQIDDVMTEAMRSAEVLLQYPAWHDIEARSEVRPVPQL
jgi:hypothetical protein